MSSRRVTNAMHNTIMKTHLVAVFSFMVMCAMAATASADVTAFVGVNTAPSNRTVRGVAAGLTLIVLGFEFEYSDTGEDLAALAPSLRTGIGSLLVQTPFPVSRIQLYGIVGGGLFRERLGSIQETNVAVGAGGGVKLKLAGPLRLRLDYRIFTLRGQPLHARPQRIYAGVNVAF